MKQAEYRAERGLSLAQFADAIGVSEVSAWRYEAGRIPEPAVLKRIMEFTSWLVRFEDYAFGREGYAESGETKAPEYNPNAGGEVTI